MKSVYTHLTPELKEVTNTVLKTVMSSPILPVGAHRICKSDLTASVNA